MDLLNSSRVSDRSLFTGGINFNLPGNGGIECRDHVSLERRALETAFGGGLAVLAIIIGSIIKNRRRPENTISSKSKGLGYNEAVRTLFLIAFAFVFGLEFAFKFSTQQMVFIINPCHMMTAVQIYLLAALPYVNRNR